MQPITYTNTNDMARLVQEIGVQVEPSDWGEFIMNIQSLPDDVRRLLRDHGFRAVRVDGVYIVHRNR